MEKVVMTLVAVIAFAFAQAQSFKFGVGYGIPWISQPIGTNSSSTSTTTLNTETGYEVSRATSSHENMKGSYGAGWNASGAFCYTLSENIGLELGIGYAVGKEYTTRSSFTDVYLENRNITSESETFKSRAISFTPALKFMTQRRDFTPYFLVGPIFSKVNFRSAMIRTADENGTVTTESHNTKFKGGFTLGLRGAVGVSVIVNKKLTLFSEIVFTGMNYYPKESEITHYIINGEDKIGTLTPNVRKTVYVDKIENDSDKANDNVNVPNRNLRFPVAMSSVSANAGVQVKLQ
ncbi:outer membrane beta-barrel protein [Chryseolinea sp. H1M3-3]|uniref:outer membrane beta-barrel protein n=1 Tax=Chryseolinea sp. H1M3-3 TaxID=3034144 RepID=UPI0023EB3FFB|nr:outer membrane beta-barrel protein [Chryseolinea sp. H1M3-3]